MNRERSRTHSTLATIVIASAVLCGCTKLLGIDGDYTLGSSAASSANDGGGADGGFGEGGGSGGSGGFGNEAGLGGDAPVAREASVVDAGGAGPVDSGEDPCGPTHFSGTFNGRHAIGATLVGVQVQVTGALSFTLEGTGGTRSVTSGTFTGETDFVGAKSGTFSATLSGSYDCATHEVSGTMLGELTASVPGVSIRLTPKFAGSWSGEVAGGAFSGGWAEQEVLAIPPPGSGGSGGAGGATVGCPSSGGTGSGLLLDGAGCGTWSTQ